MFQQTAQPLEHHLTVAQTSERLHVTPDAVRRLIRRGILPANKVGRQWFIPHEAVAKRKDISPRRGRRLAPARAWGLLFLADGDDAPWLSRDARWRMRISLEAEGLASMRDRLLDRAVVHTFRAHSSLLERIAGDLDLMLTGTSAARELHLGLLGGQDRVDAYVASTLLATMVKRHHLRTSDEPNVILRAVPPIDWSWPPARVAPRSAVALDLLDDPEPRVRQVARDLLASVRP